jgi:very-short-patch-repair endonuclease
VNRGAKLKNTDKIIALYKFIKELCSLKYNVVTDVSKQHWTCFLKDIPEDPDNIKQYYRDRVEEEANSDLVLLEVHKPEYQSCPEPPEAIIKWLVPGWDLYANEAAHKETLSKSSDPDDVNRENFSDSPGRVLAYEKWIAVRASWANKQHTINRTRRFFARLFQAYTDLEREPETLEFMLGDGLIHVIEDQTINHPILLKKVKFDFLATENIIRICDTDATPELYSIMLQNIDGIDHRAIRQLSEDLHEYFYHPLDRNDTPDFLKTLTHRLCSESKFVADDGMQIGHEDKIVTRIAPVYFIRKRIDGTLKAIESIISTIEETGYIPGHLTDIVDGGQVDVPVDDHELSIDEQLAALSGENINILLSKEANREQLEIAERIERYNAVLVQGPPGTGKTHTIANLLGHFLAQGKSVLVTSQTQKALSVLKSQVADEIKNLCVSILDDTNLDMTRSIDGITEYLAKYTSTDLKKMMASTSRQRSEIIDKLAEVRRKIYSIKFREFEPIVYNGDGYSPAQAAEFVYKNADKFSYIPGNVRLYNPLPLTTDELYQLYRSNAGITTEDESELAFDIPNPNQLMTPMDFAADLKTAAEQNKILNDIVLRLSLHIKCDFDKNRIYTINENVILAENPSDETASALLEYANSFKSIDGWMIQAAVDGHKANNYKKKWEMLIDSIQNTVAYAESLVPCMIGKTIGVPERVDRQQLKSQVIKLHGIFQRKGKITKIDFLFNKELETAVSSLIINGKPLACADDCSLVLSYLTLLEKRDETAFLWNELMAKYGSPDFNNLGNDPEEVCLQRVPNIQRYLTWYQNEYAEMLNLVKSAGLNSSFIFRYTDLDSELIKTEKALRAIHDVIPLYIQVIMAFISLRGISARKKISASVLLEDKRKFSTICSAMHSALQAELVEQYNQGYRRLSQQFEKYTLQAQRSELIKKLEPYAPDWAAVITERDGIHGNPSCPDTIEEAWKWKQFSGIIGEITSEPFKELQKKAISLSRELRRKTAELAANSAWYHLILRTESHLDMKQALQGWKLTVRKIGKGTGKNAPALRKEARGLMAKCQAAVPAWIMPASKALESFNPAKNRFDVIIVDEASQSDISALAIMYMAKKVIIVGDDKQVSPLAVGMDITKINALRDMYIKGIIPNWHLYDAKTSLYDIASTTYQPLMLREHFRCVPDIIGYSNKLSYDFKIKPLRDASKCTVKPHVVQYRVDDGQREGRNKVNKKEAETVVSLMKACVEQKEYEGKTFGVISLLGDEQATLIQTLILQKFEPAIIEERRILCGNASHFQGDQRDIIFLSMVDSNEGDGPLRIAGEGVDQSTKQRYNVAASRAKDQMWIIHSLDYTKDLKPGDMRRDLLEYAENPKAFALKAEEVAAKAESPFEEAVGKALVAAGYHIAQQWEVGAYRIDMVVQYKGKMIAVECDGELYHSGDEKVRADMERQTILERMGWSFIRIRGSEYYRNPSATMDRIIQELNSYEIWPENIAEPVFVEKSKLLSQVKIRSAQIQEEWHNTTSSEDDELPEAINYSSTTTKPIIIGNKPLHPRENIASAKKLDVYEQTTIYQIKPAGQVQQTETLVPANPKSNVNKCVNTIGFGNTSTRPIQTYDVITLIKKRGIPFIDKRNSGGALWIIGGQELSSFIAQCKGMGVKFDFKKGGGHATKGKDGWWTK